MLSLKAPKSMLYPVEVWKCPRCGRKAPYQFYEHATRLYRMDFCTGKVVKTVQVIHIAPQRLPFVKQIVAKAREN